MNKCAHPECENNIRSNNKSGVCQSHWKFQGKCKKCLRRCWIQAEYCFNCSVLKKAFESRRLVVCQYAECERTTTSHYRLCETHFATYHECKVKGCKSRVKFNSKWGYCQEHRYLSRFHIEDNVIPLAKPSPIPIRRKRLSEGKVYESGSV